MKPNACSKLILSIAFMFLLMACQWITPPSQSAPVEQNPLATAQAESPLPPFVVSLHAIDAYQATMHLEESYTQTVGTSFFVSELWYTWGRATHQHGYNAHSITTLDVTLPPEMVPPDAVTDGVMDERYQIDDLEFIYCGTCPDSAAQGGWSVYKRGPSAQVEPHSIALGAIDTIQSLYGSSIKTFVTQSNVVGREKINGIDTIHYQFTDLQALREIMSADTQFPTEIQTAQVDIWLTIPDRLLIQYIFHATGKKARSAGTSLLEPFTLEERYRVTEINSHTIITVPTEILTAVAPQIELLKGK